MALEITKDGYCPSSCPNLKSCEAVVTKDFFGRLCNTKNFVKCFHFAKRNQMLKKPMDWIVSTVVEESIVFVADVEQEIPE